MGVRVFGPARVDGAGELAGRDRQVLAALVVVGADGCSADGLAAALYGDNPPPTWRKVVQGAVVRLRRALGPRAIETTPAGYRLTLGDEEVDVRRFERLVRQASELADMGDPERAGRTLREALDFGRGEPFVDLDGWEPACAEAARISELRLHAEERGDDALLQLGLHQEAVGIARAQAERQPLREQRWVALALAQYRSGRQADALRSIARARGVLADQLGLDPGPDLV